MYQPDLLTYTGWMMIIWERKFLIQPRTKNKSEINISVCLFLTVRSCTATSIFIKMLFISICLNSILLLKQLDCQQNRNKTKQIKTFAGVLNQLRV
jgi:hypothetical protein